MDIPAKTHYMRNTARALPEGADCAAAHEQSPHSSPAMRPHRWLSTTRTTMRSTNTLLDHALYEIDLTGAPEFKQTSRSMCCLPSDPDSAISWARTREVYLQRAIQKWPTIADN